MNAVIARRDAWLLALLFFVPIVIYFPGLHGDFFLDDYPHIVHNYAIQIDQLNFDTLWTAANSTNSGPLGRPLALASFAINHYFTGLDPYYFKLINLLLHLSTGIGIFYTLRGIARRLAFVHATQIAFFTALLWAIHPLNVSTVLYSVQRMTGLATLFMVWGMVAYLHGREQLLQQRQVGWGWILLGLASGVIGMYAKETAVLILGYLLVIEGLVFRFRLPSPTQRHILQSGYLAVVGLPLAWVLTTRLFAPGWVEAVYANRAFTLNERLLTEGRVLWDYLYLTWLPNIQAMGLYHDGYPISHSLFDPPATFVALAAHATLISVAFMLHKKWPMLLFGVAWFYVGHSVEATVLPLEIKYEHRNYLAMLGMLLMMVHGIFSASTHLTNARKIRQVVIAAILLTFGGSALVRSGQFGDFRGFAGMEAEHYPDSSRANQHAAVALIKLMMESGKYTNEMVALTREYLWRSTQTNRNSTAALFTAVLFLPEFTKHPPEKKFIDELSHRLRFALPDANINIYFNALLRHAMDGKLMLKNEDVHNLFEQAGGNPEIRDDIKADILAMRAAYAQSVEHDNEQARKFIDQALAKAPASSGIYVPATWIYQEAGMWQDAASLLEKLRKLDTFGIERESIAWLSQRQQHSQSKN